MISLKTIDDDDDDYDDDCPESVGKITDLKTKIDSGWSSLRCASLVIPDSLVITGSNRFNPPIPLNLDQVNWRCT